MRRRVALARAAALAAVIACSPSRGTDPPAAAGTGKVTRGMLNVRVSEDGHIEADGKRVRDAKKLPFKGGDRVWITAVSAPTAAALTSLGAVADEALARGWLLSARVRPSPASGNPEPRETRSAPPPLTILTLGSDGQLVVPAGRVRAEDARSALADGRCEPGTAVGLYGNAPPAHYFRAAGFLAAAGCEVMVVLPSLRVPPADTMRP